MQNPILFQIPTIETDKRAQLESFNHAGPLILNILSNEFTAPSEGSNKYFHTTPEATVGVTTGRKYNVLYRDLALIFLSRETAIINPRINAPKVTATE
jgi:hypothetical protein